MSNYYELLGINRKATKSDIKKNYRLLATKYHPDKNSDPDAASKFIAITEAYEILSNKKSKLQYDLLMYETAKRRAEKANEYRVVVPPRESTRTRRNKAQRKRGVKYQQLSSQFKQLTCLMVESLHMFGHYIPHLIGISLIAFILPPAVTQVSEAFEKGPLIGIGIIVFSLALVYAMSMILQHMYKELGKDFEAFSVFYRISRKQAAIVMVLVFTITILLTASLLSILSP